MKHKIYLEPSSSSFHFFIYTNDSDLLNLISEAKYYGQLNDNRVYLGDSVIAIGTKSDFLRIPISVEVLDEIPDADNSCEWVKVVDSTIQVNDCLIKFFDPPDGDFFSFELLNGKYQLRISFGESLEPEEECSNDYYLIQIWPVNNN